MLNLYVYIYDLDLDNNCSNESSYQYTETSIFNQIIFIYALLFFFINCKRY
jgi:hypothetical protein